MKIEEFKKEIDRLKAVYGSDKYPDERVKGFWDVLGTLPFRLFGEAVSNLINNETFPPMLNKIQDELKNINSRQSWEQIQSKLPDLPPPDPNTKEKMQNIIRLAYGNKDSLRVDLLPKE